MAWQVNGIYSVIDDGYQDRIKDGDCSSRVKSQPFKEALDSSIYSQVGG